MHTRPEYTGHAITRMAQRGLSKDDLDYVMKHGRRSYNAGACAYFLGKRHIPKEDLRQDRYRRLQGTCVLVDSRGEEVITVYRNKKAFRDHLRKRKYRIRPAA